MTSQWPSSNSTILEGLRLTLGLGGDKAGASTQSGRLGAQGKVVALRTILAFVRASLGDNEANGDNGNDEIAGMFNKIFGDEGEGSGKGKGKGRQVEIDSDGVEEQMEGFLTGCGDWGLEGPINAWEIGRLETETSLAGKGAENEAVAVSETGDGRFFSLDLRVSATLHPFTPAITRHFLGSCANSLLTLLFLPDNHRSSIS